MLSSDLQKFRILIVDDEKLIQRLVYDVLIQLGFRDISVARSANQAIEFLTKESFDFIITDWRMGEGNGIDLIRHVRMLPEADRWRVPIILLTGNTEAKYVFEARDAGVNEYIIKPFSAEQLVRRIRTIIEQPRRYVDAPTYRGPERRTRALPPPVSGDRRKKPKK